MLGETVVDVFESRRLTLSCNQFFFVCVALVASQQIISENQNRPPKLHKLRSGRFFFPFFFVFFCARGTRATSCFSCQCALFLCGGRTPFDDRSFASLSKVVALPILFFPRGVLSQSSRALPPIDIFFDTRRFFFSSCLVQTNTTTRSNGVVERIRVRTTCALLSFSS